MAGRKPKPTNLRLLHGNPGKRAIPKDEPQLAVKIPPAPRTLCKAGKREFRRMAKVLAEMRVMTVADRDALELYAANYVRRLDALERVEAEGMVVYVGENAYPMPNPFLTIAQKCEKDMIKILAEFGCTPSSRTRVKIEAPKSGRDADADRLFG